MIDSKCLYLETQIRRFLSWPKKKWIDKLNNQGEAFKLEFKNFSLGEKYG